MRGLYTVKTCVTKLIGLAYSWKANKKKILSVTVPFVLCLTSYLRRISKNKLPGAHVWRGDLTEGLFCYEFWAGGPYISRGYKLRGLFSEFYDTIFEIPKVGDHTSRQKASLPFCSPPSTDKRII